MTESTVMLDCGFAVRETERRLARLGVLPGAISGIVVTHEHSDHVGGVFKLARRYGIPVWLTFGTYQAVQKHCDGIDVRFCRDGDRLAIGDLELQPFTVPHDAREPVQYVATDGISRLGVLTDVGQSTPHLIASLTGCHALMLECNYDPGMLANSTYPYFLRQRIGGSHGHLSNETTTAILAELDKSRLKRVVGAHLSQQNNTPELARAALINAIDPQDGPEIQIACQHEGFQWLEVA